MFQIVKKFVIYTNRVIHGNLHGIMPFVVGSTIPKIVKCYSSCVLEQVDPLKCASSGMFVNLSAVMLRLCEPFLDNMESKKDKIDVNYLFCNNRIDFK